MCFLSNFASSKESYLPATEYVKCCMILFDRLTEFADGSCVGVLVDPEVECAETDTRLKSNAS